MMKQFKILVILIVVLVSLMTRVNAQQVKADANVDTNNIRIGDQVNLMLNLQLPQNYQYNWPVFGDTLSRAIEIMKKSKIDTTRLENGLLNIRQVLTLQVFDSGYYVIPPIRFNFSASGNTSPDFVETEPLLLNVFTVSVDTTQAIRPIKGPIEAPYTFAEMLPWILLLAGLAIATGLVIYFVNQRKNKIPIFAPRPKAKLPPHEIALQALEQLKNEKLWQKGHVKEYYTRLTDIIREYIEVRFNIRALEFTTWEIMQSFRNSTFSKADTALLSNLLELADLVKFAKTLPIPSENDKSMNDAVVFVDSTSIKKTPESIQNPQEVKKPEEMVVLK
jgi:hypothetical protein